MGNKQQQKKSGGAKKYGRQSHMPSKQNYKAGDHRTRNKARRIVHQMNKFSKYHCNNLRPEVAAAVQRLQRKG